MPVDLPPPPAIVEAWGNEAITPWRELCEDVGETSGVDPLVLGTIIFIESEGTMLPDGRDGEIGLMQIMPFEDRPSVEELRKPAVNIHEGCRILNDALTAFDGDLAWALVAYNRGHAGAREVGLDHPAAQQYLKRFAVAWYDLWDDVPLDANVRAALQQTEPPSDREIEDTIEELHSARSRLRNATRAIYRVRGIEPP